MAQWQALYDETYGGSGRGGRGGVDPTFDIEGWNSSYTGRPIPAEEMREWVERTVARILALGPRRVLEVGCGTGLLLFRVAPHARALRRRPTSRRSRSTHRAASRGRARRLPQVELRQAAADDWTRRAARRGRPGRAQLGRPVLPGRRLPGARAGGGGARGPAPAARVFVGDVRSLPLLAALAASVELFQAPDARRSRSCGSRVRRRVADEEELVVDPAFFPALARRIPGGTRRQVLVKRGRWHNELTRFRYDVVLHVGAKTRGRAPGCRAV